MDYAFGGAGMGVRDECEGVLVWFLDEVVERTSVTTAPAARSLRGAFHLFDSLPTLQPDLM